MASFSLRRKISGLLLLAVLTSPLPAYAEPGGRVAGKNDPAAPWDRLWTALTALWGEAGCIVDPFGRCGGQSTTTNPPESLEEGCMIDPYGGCREGK